MLQNGINKNLPDSNDEDNDEKCVKISAQVENVRPVVMQPRRTMILPQPPRLEDYGISAIGQAILENRHVRSAK